MPIRCELLLFLEIMIFATASDELAFTLRPLWIAFVPWNYDICNSNFFNFTVSAPLWIAFVPWNYDICNSVIDHRLIRSQLWIAFVPWNYDICNSKDLHGADHHGLWIAFVPWNYDICNSIALSLYSSRYVVNCFCSLKLWYLQQLTYDIMSGFIGCELLLFLEIMIFATAPSVDFHDDIELWIAFVPWNYDICNSRFRHYARSRVVVNCFCSLKLWYLQQPHFVILVLWTVVNCFCSLKLWYLQQLQRISMYRSLCCELLLFLEIMIFATARS